MAETQEAPRQLSTSEMAIMLSKARQEIESAKKAKENLAGRNEFVRGVVRGTDQLQATYQGGMGMVNALVGNDAEAARRFSNYQSEMRQSTENPATVDRFFSNDPKSGAMASAGNMATWAAGTAGSLIPSVAESVVSGVAGGVAGGMLVPGPDPTDVATVPVGALAGMFGKGVVKKAIAEAAEQYVKQGVKREAAEQMATQAVRNTIAKRTGATIAAQQTTALNEGGGMYMEGREKGYDNPASAMALGQISGASEVAFGVFPASLRMVFKKAGVDEVAKKSGIRAAAGYAWDIAKNPLEEGAQEAFQEGLGSINESINDPNAKLFTKENFMKWAESAAAGALGGGMFGAGGAAVSAYQNRGQQSQTSPGEFRDTVPQNTPPQFPPTQPTEAPTYSDTMENAPDPLLEGLSPEDIQRLGSLDAPPTELSAHQWAKAVLGNRDLYTKAPKGDAARIQQWENARAAVTGVGTQYAQDQGVPDDADAIVAQQLARRQAAKAGTQPPIATEAPTATPTPPITVDSQQASPAVQGVDWNAIATAGTELLPIKAKEKGWSDEELAKTKSEIEGLAEKATQGDVEAQNGLIAIAKELETEKLAKPSSKISDTVSQNEKVPPVELQPQAQATEHLKPWELTKRESEEERRLNEVVMSGKRIAAEDQAMFDTLNAKFQRRHNATPEEAASMSDKDYGKWAKARSTDKISNEKELQDMVDVRKAQNLRTDTRESDKKTISDAIANSRQNEDPDIIREKLRSFDDDWTEDDVLRISEDAKKFNRFWDEIATPAEPPKAETPTPVASPTVPPTKSAGKKPPVSPNDSVPPVDATKADAVPMPTTYEELEALPLYSVYSSKSSDGSKVRYHVRKGGKRGFGDSVHDTIEQAQENVAIVKRGVENRKVFEEKQKADEETAAKKKADYEASFGGFLSDKPMNKGRQLKVLGASRKYQGKVVTVKDIIEQKVANGAVVNDRGQLESPDGAYLGSDKITKTGIDYAKHLIESKNRDTVSQNPKPEPKKGGDPNAKVETEGQTKAQTKTEAQADGLLGSKGDQATGGAPSSDSSLQAGDKFTDSKGQKWLVHKSRYGVVVAHPIIDGKPQVNQDSGVRFATNEVSRARNPDDRTDIHAIEKWKNEELTDRVDARKPITTVSDDELRQRILEAMTGEKKAPEKKSPKKPDVKPSEYSPPKEQSEVKKSVQEKKQEAVKDYDDAKKRFRDAFNKAKGTSLSNAPLTPEIIDLLSATADMMVQGIRVKAWSFAEIVADLADTFGRENIPAMREYLERGWDAAVKIEGVKPANDVNPSIPVQAFDIAWAAEDAGIKTFDQLVAYSVKTVGERRTREIEGMLGLAAKTAGFKGIRPLSDILGVPGVTREQAEAVAKAAFPMLPDEEVSAGIDVVERLGLLDNIGFAPFGSPVPDQSLNQNQAQGGNVKGWTSFISATRAIIGATNKADVSTFFHEIFHPVRVFILDRKVPQSKRFGITNEELQAFEDYAGAKDGKWSVDAEEKAAKAWEQYLFEGKAPKGASDELKSFFKKLSEWMAKVYQSIQQITGKPLPPEVRVVFDKLMQRNSDGGFRDTVSQNENRDTVSQKGDPEITSIKNAIVNELRARRGVPGLEDSASQSQEEWLEAAHDILQNDPNYGDRLVKELNKKARNLESVEIAVMQIYYGMINNRLTKSAARLTAAKESGDPVESANALMDSDILMNTLWEMETANKAAGSEWSRSGTARQIELDEDFSFVGVMRKARIANTGNALSDKQQEEMRELASQVADLQGKLAKEVQDNIDLRRRKNVEAQIEDSKGKVQPVPESIRKKVSDKVNAFKSKFASAFASSKKTENLFATEDEDMADDAKSVIQEYVDTMGVSSLGELLSNLRKDLGSDIPVSVQAAFTTAWKDMKDNGDIPVPTVDKNNVRGLSRLAKQIERSLVESGITELDEVVRGVHESLQEIIPDITPRETMDAMSGYGQYSSPSENPDDKIIADINGRLLELAKLNDMENKIAPARTGVGRQPLSDEHRELIRKVNIAKRDGKYRVTDPDTQLKSAVESAKTALVNRIHDLKKAIGPPSSPIVSSAKKDLAGSDEDVIAYRKERDELTAIYKTLFPKPGATMEQRIAATAKALDRVAESLEKQMETRNFETKKKAEPISTEELDAKRALIDALRAQREDIAEYKEWNEERKSKAYKANLLKQLADYEDRVRHGFYGPKPKKEVRKLSPKEVAIGLEIQKVKDEFFRLAGLYRLKNMSPRERAWDYTKETAHLSRAVMTAADASAVFRQGGAIVFSHPIMAAEVSKDMYKAMWSAASEFETAEKMRRDDMYQFAMEADLGLTAEDGKITRQEEAFLGRWARRIGLIARSARGYTTFMNGIRFALFKHMVANLGKGGQVTLDEAKVIAFYINAATGRSDLGPMMKWAEQANMLFFAPRFVASRFQYLGMPLWLLGSRKASGRVKKAIAMEYIRHSAGVGSFLTLTVALGALLAGDDEEEKPTVSLDPRSSDFLKIKLGETRIDPMSGLSQVIVLMGRIRYGQRVEADGDVVDLRGEKVPYGGLGMAGTIGNFVRTKFAPVPGAAFDIATGENVVGQDVTPFSSIVNLFIPLSLREIKDTAESRGIPQGALIALLSLHGMGSSTYGPESNYRKGTPEIREKQFKKDIRKMTFDSKEPKYKNLLSEEQMTQVSERLENRKQGMVFSASAHPIRKEYRDDETYNKAVSERDASLENLKKSGLTLEESRKLLIDHWGSSYGSVYEMRKGVRVYKEALSDRLRQLRKAFQPQN